MTRRSIRRLRPVKDPRPHIAGAPAVRVTGGEAAYGKDHLVTKVIGLATPSGRELEKSAEKAVSAVFAALGHVFTEGDVNIPEFGRLQAFKSKGKVKVTFTPAKKLEKCAEGRLYNPQPAQQPTPSPAPEPAPSPQPEPQTVPTPEPEPTPAPAPAPDPQPAPEPVPQPVPSPEPAPVPQPQPAPSPAPAPAPVPEPTPPAEATMEDVARGKQIVAPLSAPGYPIANVVDGNPETKWVSGFNVPCWLNIQLGSVYRVKRIIARAPENLTMSYRIKGCIVGHPIQDLIVVPGSSGVRMWDNLDFVISAIEVWFEASSHPSKWVEFIELEVYGVPA